jgi:Carboxypeptidase regulatory-like domain
MKTSARFLTHTIRKWNVPILAIGVALGMAMCCSNTLAQSGAGSIQGTVTDATGAVMPGALIHVVNQATGVAVDTKANEVGFYQVPDLFPGTYTVSISVANMKTSVKTIDLLVSQTAVVNAAMSAGAVSQQVTVAATTQLTDPTSGTLSETLENQRINQLPLNQRWLVTLVTETTPGVEAYCCNNESRANGLMAEAMEYVSDGAPVNDLNFGGQSEAENALLPDPDAVAEVNVVEADGNAAYATPATAVITTKSGTNSLHGSFFETMRNNAVGIAKGRSNPYNYVAPQYVRNEFGASVGGPIILPHVYHGKDKSFWFFAYERFSLAQVSTADGLVPTPAEEGGDFSGMINGSGVLQTIYDPSTTAPATAGGCTNNVGVANAVAANWCRQQYDYNGKPNTINPALISPLAKTLYAMTPPPTSSEDPLVADNIIINNKQYQYTPTIDFRLDHIFNDKNKAFLSYHQNEEQTYALRTGSVPETLATANFPAGASGYGDTPVSNFATALGYTHVFSPTFFSETNVSQQWFDWESGGLYNGTDDDVKLGLPNNFGETGFPSISGMNTESYSGTMYNYQENQIVSQIDENLTKTVAKHQMQFGVRLRHERIYYLNSRNADTTSFANGQTTGLENWTVANTSATAWANTGLADADFFVGGANSYSVQLEPPPVWFVDQEYDAYFQDNWHVRQNLTLNLGVRYVAEPPRTTRGDVNDSIDLQNPGIVLGAPISKLISEGWTTQAIIDNMEADGVTFQTAAEAGMPSTLYDGADLNLLPRVGFAWQPFGKRGTVLRGGYGEYADTMPTRNFNPGPTSVPFAYSYSQNYESATQTPDNLPNYNLRSIQNSTTPYSPVSPSGTGTPIAGVDSTNVINTNVTGVAQTGAILPGIGGTFFDYDRKPDFAKELNVTVEQPLWGESALRVSYVWTHGSNLDNPYYPNDSPSAYVWEVNTGTLPPSGGAATIGTNQYAATALGPWNNITYGNFNWSEKEGWSNDPMVQINYQHLFHHGYAYQFQYVRAWPYRLGDNSTRDSQIYPTQDYVSNSLATTTSPAGESAITPGFTPPTRPSGIASYANWHGLNQFEQYILDTGLPQQHIQFNYIMDLPVGTGKKLLGNANRLVDELVGGWQIAGDGQMISQDFQPAASNYGPTSPLQIYKKQHMISDCTSGTCHPDFLWFNGYFSPKVLTPGEGGTCASNCVTGLPGNYIPYETPIDNNPALANFGTNDVLVSSPAILAANSGNPETVSYSPGPAAANVFSHTIIKGPFNYNYDISLYKVFPVTERTNFRVNLDAFNAFNQQGLNNPSSTTSGEVYTQPGVSGGASSYWTPRQLQLSMRFTSPETPHKLLPVGSYAETGAGTR